MSAENANLPPNSPSRSHSIPILKNNEEVARTKEKRMNDEGSLHSYHLWLKEKQLRENEEKKQNVKLEDDEEDGSEDNFRVEAVLERGPSPPESDNSNAYEWSYEEQFKQVCFFYFLSFSFVFFIFFAIKINIFKLIFVDTSKRIS